MAKLILTFDLTCCPGRATATPTAAINAKAERETERKKMNYINRAWLISNQWVRIAFVALIANTRFLSYTISRWAKLQFLIEMYEFLDLLNPSRTLFKKLQCSSIFIGQLLQKSVWHTVHYFAFIFLSSWPKTKWNFRDSIVMKVTVSKILKSDYITLLCKFQPPVVLQIINQKVWNWDLSRRNGIIRKSKNEFFVICYREHCPWYNLVAS